ncbi:hypothetical protein Tco_0316725 [Tanacetum coccineum]
MGWKLRRRKWTGTTEQLIEDLESAYGKSEPLYYNYLRPLTSLDEGLYALACEEDVRCLATLVIEDVMRQLSFEKTELDGEAGFGDVAGSGIESSELSHDESFRVEYLDLNLNKPVDLNVRTHVPILEEVIVEDYVNSGEDAEQGTDDDDGDVFLVDEENEIVELDVNVHLFGISMDVSFDNIGVTNLVLDDVLEGEDVDVINADSFDSDPGNDNETSNYRRRRLVKLIREMEGVINASGQWKYSFYTGQKFTTTKEAKDRVYLHPIKSRLNLKLYKNDSVKVRARCDGKVHVFTMSQGNGPTGPNQGMKAEPSGLSGLTIRSKKRKNTGTNDDSQACSSTLDVHDKGDLCPWVLDYVVELQSTNPNTTVKIAVERNIDPSLPTKAKYWQLLDLIQTMEFTHWPMPWLKLKDLLWRSASATSVKEFEKCMLELKKMNPKAHEWLNKISPEHWVKSHFSVGGMDNPVTTLLEYIREYYMKRILNVQSVIDKCIGPLTPTATRIIESIKKEAYVMKVKWNRGNKYQVSGIPYKHAIVSCWNMALNDRATPPPEAWEKSTCPTTLLLPKHHVKVGMPKKKRKRSKHEDGPYVKDGKVSKKIRTITCQSCESIGHNKATCKGQGSNNAKASGSASRQAQQAEPVVSQDGSGGSSVGAVIGLSAIDCAGGVGVGVGSQCSSHTRWTKRRVQTLRISLQKTTPTQPASQPSTNSQVLVTETRNADRRELGDGIPT